ncbi:AAEL010550-PA, partial [Aedes aegypti]
LPEKARNSPLFILAPDQIVAKYRFWYFLRQLRKFKETTGVIVSVKRLLEKTPLLVMIYGICLRNDSSSGTHNAINQCYSDTASRHRTRAHSIQIVRVESVKASNNRRVHTKQFHDSKIRSMLVQRYQHKRYRKLFSFHQPYTYYQ